MPQGDAYGAYISSTKEVRLWMTIFDDLQATNLFSLCTNHGSASSECPPPLF